MQCSQYTVLSVYSTLSIQYSQYTVLSVYSTSLYDGGPVSHLARGVGGGPSGEEQGGQVQTAVLRGNVERSEPFLRRRQGDKEEHEENTE